MMDYRVLRELVAIFTALFFASLIVQGCGAAVRDPEVYASEISFIEAASSEQVERGIELIDAVCACDGSGGVLAFTTPECQDLADTILVVKSRMAYHTAFMRYLGGISDERPPKDPPEIPDPNTLCPGVGEFDVMPIPDEIKLDAGVDAGD